jgi:hypothetical protein
MRWWWLVALIAVWACAKETPESAEEQYQDSLGGYGAKPMRKSAMAGAPAPEAAPAPMESMEYERGAPADMPAAPPPSAQTPTPAAQRMVHYDGWARLLVADPPATLDAVVAVADGLGGRTERMAGNVVSVRVPHESFANAWEQIRALGDVMDEAVRADDVTDQFLDTDLRVKTLERTLARLVQLLAKAEAEEEKLRLIQEITRVTEELDTLRIQLRTISDLAAMARITVEAVPRQAFAGGGGQPEPAGMEWVRALSPFQRSVWADGRRIPLATPSGLVELDKKGPYIAEGADGTVLWTIRVANDPVGDGAFWTAAIAERIGSEFANPTLGALGRWSCLTLDEPGSDEPYRWTVCVADEGKWLHVAQAYFPTPAAATRWAAGVASALTAGGDT